MTARLPAAEELTGRFVRLRPLTPADHPELHRALGRPEVFAGGYGGGPAGHPPTEEAFLAFARDYYRPAATRLPWAVRLVGGPDEGRLVGASTLGDLDVANEAAHIGWTAYDPRVWGTVVNPETKLLLLGLAFGSGFGRVRLQADAANGRSRAAIAKIGARFEGIARRDQRRADGSWRDTAVYSIVVDEWPAVRAGLEARVAAAGTAPLALG